MHATAIPDWLDFPDVDKPYVEQIYERREPKVSPKRRHALLQFRMCALLARWAGDRGEAGTEWRCYLVSGETNPSSLVPDVAYFSYARLPPELDEDARERPRIAPDVAVEVLSPRDRKRTLSEKIALYLRHGATVVIVLDPIRRIIALHRTGTVAIFDAGKKISVEPFSDLTLDFDELFRGL